MTTFYYTLIVREPEPVYAQPGWFWLQLSTGTLYLRGGTSWIALASCDTDITGLVLSKIYWKTLIVQDIPPTTEDYGQIWTKSTEKASYVWLGLWIQFAGGA